MHSQHRQIKHSKLISKGRKNMKYGLCFTCGNYKRPKETKLPKCEDASHQHCYYEFEWEDYCKKNKISVNWGSVKEK